MTEESVTIPRHIDFTAPLPPFRSIDSATTTDVRPTNSTDNNGPFCFKISRDDSRYLQTSFFTIQGSQRITKKGGVEIVENDKAAVCPMDFYGQAWINKIEVYAKNNRINAGSGSGYNYHTKVLVNTLLNYDIHATTGHLRSSGFPPEEEPIAATSNKKTEWDKIESWESQKANKIKFANSKWVEFSADLQVDVLRTNRDFPNDMQLEIRIYRNTDDYILCRGMYTNAQQEEVLDERDYEMHFDDLRLQIRQIKPNDEVLRMNNQRIMKMPALYQFQNWTAAEEVFRSGVKNYSTQALFNVVPTRTVYLLLDFAAYSGDKKLNPSFFKHWDIEEFIQTIGGVPKPVSKLKFDWDNDNIAESYRALLDGCGISTLNRSNLITYEMYKKTRFMIVLDNSPEGLTFDGARSKKVVSPVSVSIKFRKNLPKAVLLLAFGISDDIILIDKDREATIDSTIKRD